MAEATNDINCGDDHDSHEDRGSIFQLLNRSNSLNNLDGVGGNNINFNDASRTDATTSHYSEATSTDNEIREDYPYHSLTGVAHNPSSSGNIKPCLVQRNSLDCADLSGLGNPSAASPGFHGCSSFDGGDPPVMPPPALKQTRVQRLSQGDCAAAALIGSGGTGFIPVGGRSSPPPLHHMVVGPGGRESVSGVPCGPSGGQGTGGSCGANAGGDTNGGVSGVELSQHRMDLPRQIGSIQPSSFTGANNSCPILPGAGPFDHTPIVNLLLDPPAAQQQGPASSTSSGIGATSSGSSLATLTGGGVYSGERVCLLVDGVRFLLDPAMLRSKPETVLGRMFINQWHRDRAAALNASNSDIATSSPNASSSSLTATSSPNPISLTPPPPPSSTSIPLVVIGRDGPVSAAVFGAVLDYYRHNVMRCPPQTTVQELKEAADYFRIPFNHRTIKCSNLRAFLHEVSNDGAHDLFEKFLEDEILPELVKCAQLGERESHVVILTDDDIVDWDEDYPPQMPENEINSQIVHSTQMFRFLKYIENREVAKQVLQERGMKKIRIGIEGYPTYKEKIKKRHGYRPEVIYNYAQRPFLRMSWEEEEHKSRHVDFQCVTSKSLSDLTSLEEVAVERSVDLPASLAPPTAPHTEDPTS